jgi:RNA polymerase sigma factor (sigma-70 family)
MNSVLRHLSRAVLVGATDGQLLDRFLSRRDEAAFEALVRRHGPMVLAVCQRVLRQEQDAEDAFQASFLVLARKATSLRARELLGNWLYGVAYRTAMKARTMNARRRAREGRAGIKPTAVAPTEDGWEELLPRLDEELSKLPDKYRVPVVLCDLEGKSRREVAQHLKVPEGTVSSRLATARKLLARRLGRYGLAVSGGALAAALSEQAASACVRATLATSTARVAVLMTTGQALTAGAVPARVVALTEGVVKTMLLTKLRGFVAVGLVLAVSAGVVGLSYRTGAAEPKQPVAPGAAQAADDDLEALRLEVEALRKSLQATRERVRALEDEVAALKGTKAEAAPAPNKPSAAVLKEELEREKVWMHKLANEKTKDLADQKRKAVEAAEKLSDLAAQKMRQTADPLAEAEAALKKLKERPDDKQAADALEKALQRLKERANTERREWQQQRLKEQPKPEGQPENPGM